MPLPGPRPLGTAPQLPPGAWTSSLNGKTTSLYNLHNALVRPLRKATHGVCMQGCRSVNAPVI